MIFTSRQICVKCWHQQGPYHFHIAILLSIQTGTLALKSTKVLQLSPEGKHMWW